MEPVLGEGGYVVPPPSFMHELRAICDEHGILLIFDEVQTGFGRTGKFFALEHFGVIPDVMIVAKGLATGMPLSGRGRQQRYRGQVDTWFARRHLRPEYCLAAAAAETIRVMKDEKLIENATARGDQLHGGSAQTASRFPDVIGDVRGIGACMVATEFVDKEGKPDMALTNQMVKICADQQLLLLTCGTYQNVIRWIPPLMVTEKQIDDALQIFAAALDRAA